MSDEKVEDNDGIRDIHHIKSRFESQKKRFKQHTSKTNYDDWLIYDSWLIGHGRKLSTRLKQLGAIQRLLGMYFTLNLKDLTKEQIIEVNSIIVTSKYKVSTKIQLQLFFRQYLEVFKVNKSERMELHDLIKILPEPHESNPDSDEEEGKIISYSEYVSIHNCMKNDRLKMKVKVLFATGMRITELYNIIPTNTQFIKKKFWFLELPPSLFGYKGAWIYTRGKRTRSKVDGRYLYFMMFFVDDFKKFIDKCPPDKFVFNYSYSYFLYCLQSAVKKLKLPYSVHPHLFRHTYATKLFKNYSDQTVKKMMNWSKNSNMQIKYSHMRKTDIEDKTTNMKLK